MSPRPLPPYTHIPGVTPHPLRDPAGHSYRGDEAPEADTSGGIRPMAVFGPLSPASDIHAAGGLVAGERVGVRGPHLSRLPPHPGPLPHSGVHSASSAKSGGEGAETTEDRQWANAPDISPPPHPPLIWADLPTHPEFQWAVQLFNAGYYWESHEAWESLWHAAGRTGALADFLKGLIKLAAAGVKLREHNWVGVERHSRRAQELFRQIEREPSPADGESVWQSLPELIEMADQWLHQPPEPPTDRTGQPVTTRRPLPWPISPVYTVQLKTDHCASPEPTVVLDADSSDPGRGHSP